MRIRTVKPDFWQHPEMGSLPRDARLVALALLNWADDEGYFPANPALLAGSLFPFDEDSRALVEASLRALARIGYISIRGGVGRVMRFADHQRIDRPSKSRWRPKYEASPAETLAADQDSTSTRRVLDEPSLLEVEVEREVEQGSGRSARKKPRAAGKVAAEPPDPRHHPTRLALEAAFAQARGGARLAWDGYTAKALATCLGLAGAHDDGAEVVARWKRALAHVGYPTVATVVELARNWDHFAPAAPAKRSGAPARAEDSAGWFAALPDDPEERRKAVEASF